MVNIFHKWKTTGLSFKNHDTDALKYLGFLLIESLQMKSKYSKTNNKKPDQVFLMHWNIQLSSQLCLFS